MIKQASLALILSISTGSALADSSRANYQTPPSIQETTGAVSGLVIGGLVGGPPGAVLGGALGALFGEGRLAKAQVGDLQASLYSSQLEVAAAREEAQRLQHDYQLAQQELNDFKTNRAQVLPANLTVLSDPCCDNTVISLHFRTGSSAIEPHYEEQLTSLVDIAKQMPTGSIEITGYADRNGDSDLNLRLSRERSTTVKQFFNRMGIQNSSIRTVAYGETRPLQSQQNFESDFFDRRVIVRLRDSSTQMLSQSPLDE